MGDTTIEWTNKVWNPTTGCTKISQGCKHCYAERIFPRPYPGRAFTDVRTHPDRLDQPLRWRKPSRIFVNSMSDLFHEDVPGGFIQQVWLMMQRAHRERGHIFQLLTKRPQRMVAFLTEMPPHGIGWYHKTGNVPNPEPGIWLGVSVEDQATADERIPLLLQTPAAIRFVSYEPALEAVDFDRWLWEGVEDEHGGFRPSGKLHWIISGGESGPHARASSLDWFRGAMDQCKAAEVAFFMKQITERGRKVPYESFPAELRVREYPA